MTPFRSPKERKAAFAKGGRASKDAKAKRAPLSAIKPGTVLHRTLPHHEHKILLVEDQPKVANRIYEIQGHKDRLGILGSELESLAAWWAKERRRPGKEAPEPMPEGGHQVGYDDALHQISFAVSQGDTVADGIKAHQDYRKVGDLFTADKAGFHQGAREAYQWARQHPEHFRRKGGQK